jgi:hypothetical protein
MNAATLSLAPNVIDYHWYYPAAERSRLVRRTGGRFRWKGDEDA